MKTLTLDIAKKAGFAIWEFGTLVKAGEICRMPGSQRLMRVTVHYPDVQLKRPPDVYDGLTEREAWRLLLGGDDIMSWPDQLVIEAAHVRFAKAALILGEHQGRVIAHLGFESYTKVTKVKVPDWRTMAKATLGAMWPKRKKGTKGTPAFKLEAQRIVLKHFHVDAGDNAADAILVGHYWNLKHAPHPLPVSYPGAGKRRGARVADLAA